MRRPLRESWVPMRFNSQALDPGHRSFNMKSFSINQCTFFINIAQALNISSDYNVHQISHPKKINQKILKEFEQREKKIKIITGDRKIHMTDIVRVDANELVVRLPDCFNIGYADHVLVIFSAEGNDYVIQGFVKKILHPFVSLAYYDPRFGTRWRIDLAIPVSISLVPEVLVTLFRNRELQLVRRSEQINPEEEARSKELKKGKGVKQKMPVILTIEDIPCSNVELEPEPDQELDVLVFDYEEETRFVVSLSKYKTAVLIHDISVSGLAIVIPKGEEAPQVGRLVYIELPSLFSKNENAAIHEFKVRIFGLVRYKRQFNSEDSQVLGIKFAKTIKNTALLDLFEQIGTPVE